MIGVGLKPKVVFTFWLGCDATLNRAGLEMRDNRVSYCRQTTLVGGPDSDDEIVALGEQYLERLTESARRRGLEKLNHSATHLCAGRNTKTASVT